MSAVEEQPRAALRRQWLAKALFESGFIVLGLVGALLVDEWRDERVRAARVEAALASIRVEMTQNRDAIAGRLNSNEELIATLRAMAAGGKRYESGIIRPGATNMSSIVWEATRDSGITSDIPLETLIVLGRAYTTLDAYLKEMADFSAQLYADREFGETFRRDPMSLVGRYNDTNRRIVTLLERTDAALKVLPSPAR
jgi:hypothetical protein